VLSARATAASSIQMLCFGQKFQPGGGSGQDGSGCQPGAGRQPGGGVGQFGGGWKLVIVARA
jgi:hypothetical protein